MTDELDIPPGVHPQALLLPWFLGGTLTEFEREAINAHLFSCRACQLELESVRASRELVRDALGRADVPSSATEQRVMQAIGPQPSLRRAAPRGMRNPLLLRRLAAGLSIAVIGVQGVAILYLSRPQATTLPPVVASRGLAPARAQVRVLLAPTATEREVRQLLLALNAHIIDGPGSDGGYVLELAPSGVDAHASPLERLRANPGLVLEATPVLP